MANSTDDLTPLEFMLAEAKRSADRAAYFATAAVSVNDFVYYHGSEENYHGDYWVAYTPAEGKRGYILTRGVNGESLYNVSRESFTLTPPF